MVLEAELQRTGIVNHAVNGERHADSRRNRNGGDISTEGRLGLHGVAGDALGRRLLPAHSASNGCSTPPPSYSSNFRAI